MQNIDVRFNATSNFAKVRGDLAALEAQAASLNATLSKRAYAAPGTVDPKGWKTATDAVNVASRAYRNAASSSGLMTTQQIKATSEAERYTKALQKQKLSMGDMLRHRGIMKQVYQDQLRYQRMAAQYWGTDTAGRAVTDIAIPKNVPRDLDTMGRRVGYLGTMVASAGKQFINLGKNIQWAGRQLTVGFTYPVALFGAAAGVAAYKAEAGFAKINKVYDVSKRSLTDMAARERELGNLRTKSIGMATVAAEKYGSTLGNTLAVEQELAATGLKGQNLLSSTQEVLRISALGDIDPSQTTKMVIALSTAFRKSIPDAKALTSTLNFMNAASNATSLSLQDIAEATPRAASGLAALGVDARQMTIMLVAMREAGVDAAEGAQALKSATARILNPTILAKATKMFKGFGAPINVAKLSTEAKGNFYDFIKLLGEAEGKQKNLTNQQKNAANAALFGTYQFNRLTAALTNITDAYGGVNNQTAAAIKLQEQSNEQLAKTAEASRKAMMDNPAGKFRAEWAKFQIQLTKIGDSFLEVGTKILGAFTGVASFFNDLPSGTKKMALLGAGLLALAGPVIMLTGLAFNLFGQFTTGVGNLMKGFGRLTTGFRLVNKEEQAAVITAEAQNKAYQQQSATINTVVEEMQALAASYREATAAARQYFMQTTGQAAGSPKGFIGPAEGKPLAKTTYVPTPQERRAMSVVPTRDAGGRFVSQQLRLEQARNNLAQEYMAANKQVARDATTIQTRNNAISRQTAAIEKHTTGAAVAGGAMALSMGVMMVNSNKVVDSVAKWVMVSALVIPAVKTIAAWTAATAKSAWSYAAGMNAGSLATGRAAGIRGIGASIGAGVGGIAKAIGPGGLITAGILAAGFGIMKWRDHLESVRKEQIRVSESVNDMTATWAKGAGLAAKKYNEMKIAQSAVIDGEKSGPRTQSTLEAYSGGGFKQTMKDFKSLSGDEQGKFALEHFLELQIRYGLTAKQAAQNIKIMYGVAGKGALEANEKAESLLTTLGSLNKQQTANAFFTNQIGIYSGKKQGSAEASSAAKDVSDAFKNAVATAGPKMKTVLIKQFSDAAIMGWDRSLQAFSTKFAGASEALKKVGITTGEQLRAAIKQAGSSENFLESIGIADPTGQIRKLFDDADKAEKLFFGNISKGTDSIGMALDDSVNTLEEFLSVWNLLTGAVSTGAEQTENFSQHMHVAAAAARTVADNVKSIPKSLNINISISKTEFVKAYRTGMQNVQSEMADSATAAFDQKWDSAISKQEAANSAAEDGQKARHQAALDRIQAQIDAEKKADDIRQKLFENEKTRLQRLADMQNRNIDFNQAVNEGRLDDAAKIANDAQAQTAINAMEDEDKRAQALSDAKVARLEKQSQRLQKIQQKQEAAASRAHQNQISNMQKERDYEKAMLDQRLELFKAYTARNKKDLERWMRVVGLSYDDFGTSVKAKGKSWSEFFRTELASQVRLAATEIANDKVWEGVTKGMVRSLLNGLGFPDMAAFTRFMQTGKLPKGFGGNATSAEAHHTGGTVGSGQYNMGGVGRAQRSLLPSERMVRAQVGEKIVNRTQSRRYGPIIDAINSGNYIPPNGVMGGQAAADNGPTRSMYPIAGFAAGGLATMLAGGFSNALARAVKKVHKRSKGPAAHNAAIADSQTTSGGFIAGTGGRHRPINVGPTSGIHDVSTGYPAIDFAASVGHPVYAVSDGVVTRSYDIRGNEPRRAQYGKAQDGFRSYGRVIYLKTGAGPEVLYAHLSRRSVAAGKQVKGGSVLGYSGDTGNSTGPHLHFGSRGASPYAWLRNGGEIKWDNTPVVAHRGETVLTASLTKKFKENVASGGGGDYYDIDVDLRGAYIKEDVDIKKAVHEAIAEKENKVGRKKVIH
jgi:TP901 family phage tail tape measure protein